MYPASCISLIKRPSGVQGPKPPEIVSNFRIKSSIMKTFFNRVLHRRKLVQIRTCLSSLLTVYIVNSPYWRIQDLWDTMTALAGDKGVI